MTLDAFLGFFIQRMTIFVVHGLSWLVRPPLGCTALLDTLGLPPIISSYISLFLTPKKPLEKRSPNHAGGHYLVWTESCCVSILTYSSSLFSLLCTLSYCNKTRFYTPHFLCWRWNIQMHFTLHVTPVLLRAVKLHNTALKMSKRQGGRLWFSKDMTLPAQLAEFLKWVAQTKEIKVSAANFTKKKKSVLTQIF